MNTVETMETSETKPEQNQSERRIYVACLASYNNGVLHGRWIDADQDADDIQSEVAAMLRASKYPNVEVDCPFCEESTNENTETTCPTCGGTHKVPSAEEWAIHDYEGFGPIKLSESESFETVAALAAAIEEHGEIFAHFYGHAADGDDVDEVVSKFEENYSGAFDSLADYVADYWDQVGWKEDQADAWWHPTKFIDWERMAHDLELSGDVFTIELDGKVHVFNNH